MILLCLILTLPLVFASTADYEHNDLTQVPVGIPSDTEILSFNNNSIEVIDSFPYLPVIYNINLNKNKLAAFPNVCSVNLTLTTLSLWDNVISTVDSTRLDCLQSLQTLQLSGNDITAFPVVTIEALDMIELSYNSLTQVPRMDIIAPNTEKLYIHYNPISVPDLIAGLSEIKMNISIVHLQGFRLMLEDWGALGSIVDNLTMHTSHHYISFFDNKITEIPDLSFVAESMYELSLSANPVTHLDLDTLLTYTALEKFSCNYCHLTTLPNLCTLNNGLMMEFHLQHIRLVCDYRTEWMVAGIQAGILDMDDRPCSSPQEMSDIGTNDLTVGDFRAVKSKVHTVEVVSKRSEEFQCQSVLRIIGESDLSLVGCGTMCVMSSDCLAINYDTNHTGKSCRFLGVSNVGPLAKFGNMYILK